MSTENRRAFSLIEVLVVVMLISAGILPIYSLMRSGQRRIVRADTRVMATLLGASALELARTLGYDKAQNLQNDNDYKALLKSADDNGFEMRFEPALQPVLPLPPGAKPLFLLRIKITVKAKTRTSNEEIPVLSFVTILTDPRYNFY
jgi:prepilin-type N-terminal cleavage/methylation domain-containing protein